MLKEGDPAPDFSLPDASGKSYSLKDFTGRTLVLYFYPRDDTEGCTIEACEFRDAEKKIAAKDAVVVGVSDDSPESHAKFAKKYGLKFLLLCDSERTAIKAYGSWGKKKFMGKEFDGTFRNTFVIGPKGKIAKVFTGVSPKGHASTILGAIA